MKVVIDGVEYKVTWMYFGSGGRGDRERTECFIVRSDTDKGVGHSHVARYFKDQHSKENARKYSLDAALRRGSLFTKDQRKLFWEAYFARKVKVIDDGGHTGIDHKK